VETVKSPAEQRVVLRNASWETYKRLLEERDESRVPRFHYDQGVLEIVSPSSLHDRVSRIIALLVELLAAELGLDVENAGSTTFKREDLGHGFEPDECFYFGDAARVREKNDIDLDSGDPPPDLVVEVDITHPSLEKLPIYARLSILEVWRYDGERLAILLLKDDGTYEEVAESAVLPSVSSEALTSLVREGLSLRRPDWVYKVREWARGLRA
jgi:Uma2 family endonuclease